MVSTITARLCCRCPLTDFDKSFAVLCTLLFEYLQKLVEGVVRDFASPEAFHAVKIQRFKAKCIKLCAKFVSKLPLPIKALTRNLSMESCQSTSGTIPIARTFGFPTQHLVERLQRFQGLFEKLRGLNLVTFVTCEKCFVSIIKTCALTRLGFEFGIVNILARKVYPIVSAPISLDGDRLDETFYFSVFVQGKPCIYAIDFDAVCFQFIACLRERHRVVFVARLDFRSADLALCLSCFSVFFVVKKCVLRFAITQYNVLDNLTR